MPAILRNSLPNYVASHTVSGQSLPFGVVVAGARRVLDPVCSADRVGVVVLSLSDLMLEVRGVCHEAHYQDVEQYR